MKFLIKLDSKASLLISTTSLKCSCEVVNNEIKVESGNVSQVTEQRTFLSKSFQFTSTMNKASWEDFQIHK